MLVVAVTPHPALQGAFGDAGELGDAVGAGGLLPPALAAGVRRGRRAEGDDRRLRQGGPYYGHKAPLIPPATHPPPTPRSTYRAYFVVCESTST